MCINNWLWSIAVCFWFEFLQDFFVVSMLISLWLNHQIIYWYHLHYILCLDCIDNYGCEYEYGTQLQIKYWKYKWWHWSILCWNYLCHCRCHYYSLIVASSTLTAGYLIDIWCYLWVVCASYSNGFILFTFLFDCWHPSNFNVMYNKMFDLLYALHNASTVQMFIWWKDRRYSLTFDVAVIYWLICNWLIHRWIDNCCWACLFSLVVALLAACRTFNANSGDT